MSDGKLLLIAVVVFTLYECLRWVPARAWIFQALGGKGWRDSQPWEIFRTRGGGLALLMPVPPFEAHVITAAWPCVPHEAGLCLWNDESGAMRHVPWDQVRALADGAVLHLTPEHRVRCIHAASAEAWEREVNAWVKQPQEQRRRSFLKRAAAMLKVKPLLREAQLLQKRTRWLRSIGGWIFLLCFLVTPATYWRFGDSWPALAAAGVLLGLMIIQAIFVARQVRRDARLKKGALQHVLSAALFPPASMRVADWVCASCSPESHPLAGLKAWGKPESLAKVAGRLWRHARWPIGDVSERPWNGPEVAVLATFLKEHGIAPATLEASPELPEGSTRWCPRCHIPYRDTVTECEDCGGMKLMSQADVMPEPKQTSDASSEDVERARAN
jgi:hypothetical protein